MSYAQSAVDRMKKPESLSHTDKEKRSRASQYYVIVKALAIVKDINEMAYTVLKTDIECLLSFLTITVLPILKKICSFKFIKIFLEGFPFRLGVMILHLISQLQIIVSLSLLYLCRLSKDPTWMVSSWQHFATVWKTPFGYYEREISSLKVWISSEISTLLFKSTEIVSVTPRLLSLLLSFFAFTSFFSAFNCFLAIFYLHGYSKIPAFLIYPSEKLPS